MPHHDAADDDDVIRRGVDTNVIIYAQFPALPDHPAVRRFLLEQLRRRDVALVVTPGILHELVHVVTDARRFEAPLPLPEAMALARLWLNRGNVECLAPSPEVVVDAFDLMDRHRLGRKRIADTLLAATLLHHGVHELITCDPGDFEIFDGLHVIDPRAEPSEATEPPETIE